MEAPRLSTSGQIPGIIALVSTNPSFSHVPPERFRLEIEIVFFPAISETRVSQFLITFSAFLAAFQAKAGFHRVSV